MRLVRVNNPVNQFNAMDRLLNDFFNQGVQSDRFNRNELNYVPATNIYETENSVEIEISIPGFDKEQVMISVEENQLIIKGEVQESEKETVYSHIEFKPQEFEKKFKLTDKVDDQKINASFKNGILKLSIQKKEEVVPQKRKIEIA